MQIHHDLKNQRVSIRRAGILLGGLCLAAAGCASSHENERGDATVRARSHDGRHDNYDHNGVAHDRNGHVIRDANGRPVTRDADGRVVDADEHVVRDDARVARDADGNVVREDGRVVDADGHVVRDADGRPIRNDDERARAADVSVRSPDVKPVSVASVPENTENPAVADTDRALSARIRKAIVADDRLSKNAKNVQIMSNKDEVTLRGPVTTAEEKSRVESHAQQEAGSRHVNNQLEVR